MSNKITIIYKPLMYVELKNNYVGSFDVYN